MGIRAVLLPVLLALAPVSVQADACRDRIVALYDGGAMDDTARPPYHHELTQYAADGTVTERFAGQVISGTQYTMFGEVSQMGVLYVGTEIWYSSGSPDGPWGSKQVMPEVRAEDLRRQAAEKAASVSEAECLGPVQDDGKTYEAYRWRVFTETLESYGGGINGAVHEAWVDPETGLLAMLRDSEMVNPWQKEPDGSVNVTRYRYDDSIVIERPAGQ